jgi:hypothetical protein
VTRERRGDQALCQSKIPASGITCGRDALGSGHWRHRCGGLQGGPGPDREGRSGTGCVGTRLVRDPRPPGSLITTGSLSLPWLPSQYSVLPESSAMACIAQNFGAHRAEGVPLDQGLGAVLAERGRLALLVRCRPRAAGAVETATLVQPQQGLRRGVTPAWATARSSATITALTPAASLLGLWTASSSSLMSTTGAGRLRTTRARLSLCRHHCAESTGSTSRASVSRSAGVARS